MAEENELVMIPVVTLIEEMKTNVIARLQEENRRDLSKRHIKDYLEQLAREVDRVATQWVSCRL